MVERQLPKLNVAGSSPVFRSKIKAPLAGAFILAEARARTIAVGNRFAVARDIALFNETTCTRHLGSRRRPPPPSSAPCKTLNEFSFRVLQWDIPNGIWNMLRVWMRILYHNAIALFRIARYFILRSNISFQWGANHLRGNYRGSKHSATSLKCYPWKNFEKDSQNSLQMRQLWI